jgi:uncharacterized membrane protein
MGISVFLVSLRAFSVMVWLTAKLVIWFIEWADKGIAETFEDRH